MELGRSTNVLTTLALTVCAESESDGDEMAAAFHFDRRRILLPASVSVSRAAGQRSRSRFWNVGRFGVGHFAAL